MRVPQRLLAAVAASLAAVAAPLAACGPHEPASPPPTPLPASGSALAPGPAPMAMPMPDAGDDAQPLTIDDLAKGASILAGLGDYHRPITTASADAQMYFDQGLRLAYGFNHDESARSFARATQLDPTCASCYWGVALVLGPNYNTPMLPDRFAAAWDALGKAKANAARATPVEQALIGALARRYASAEPADAAAMAPLQAAYADAMTAVAEQFPDDEDVQVLRCEAIMDLHPWQLWGRDGTPATGTLDVIATLEKVLKKDPRHPGANHFYIHAVESSPHPERGVPSADRLAALMPGAGHIVHMPAHIYQRVGRYADATNTNRKAVEADLEYIGKVPAWGYYRMYVVHNYGFLSYSASMEGRSAEALDAATQSAKNFPIDMVEMMPGMDFFISMPVLAMVRFGKWDDILATPRPDAKYATLTALWLHAHGLALLSKGKLDDAAADLAELRKLAATIPESATTASNSVREVVLVSGDVLEAAIAQKKGDATAPALWAAAVAAEDHLLYNEPADWYYPVRHYQGAALLLAKQYKAAEAVFREDLRRNPQNGWSLWGLARALDGQKKPSAAVKDQFAKAWSRADLTLTSTAFLP